MFAQEVKILLKILVLVVSVLQYFLYITFNRRAPTSQCYLCEKNKLNTFTKISTNSRAFARNTVKLFVLELEDYVGLNNERRTKELFYMNNLSTLQYLT